MMVFVIITQLVYLSSMFSAVVTID